MAITDVPQSDRLHVELDPAAVLASYTRHRRRFAAAVATLDDAALATQSRCSQWSVADVLRHVCDVDGWMRTFWAGEPPPFTRFDPVVTPHEFVVAGRAISDVDARARFVESSEVMAADIGGSDRERWGLPSISPVGFVPWWLSAVHVFYDSWLHERDVALPLSAPCPVEMDEAQPVLAYSLGLVGSLITEPTDAVIDGVRLVAGTPPVVVTPLADASGPDVATVIDALSGRGELEDAFAGTGTDPAVVDALGALVRRFRSGGSMPPSASAPR